MHLDELFGDVKPESGPGKLPGHRHVHLLELVKNVFELVFWYANSGTRDAIEQVLSLLFHPNRGSRSSVCVARATCWLGNPILPCWPAGAARSVSAAHATRAAGSRRDAAAPGSCGSYGRPARRIHRDWGR